MSSKYSAFQGNRTVKTPKKKMNSRGHQEAPLLYGSEENIVADQIARRALVW